uniref:Disease resistance RPP13-like protein 4 n=1 Tax=Quercus lobata TaxID=97700 RepID=A0A7N2L3X0_QUELO
MSSYGELFSQTNHDEATRNITNAFVNLFYRFSQVKKSINQCSGSNSTTDSNCRAGSRPRQVRPRPKVPNYVEPPLSNSGSSNLNNNNSGLSLNDSYLCNKLQDLNQIKEAFLELEQLVRIPIKNFPKQGNKSDLIYCWFSGVIDFERSLNNMLVQGPTGSLTTEDIQDNLSALENHAMNMSHKPVTNRYKMRPRVRYLVIILATEAGIFDYDFNGNPTANSSRCNRTYLLKAEDGTSKQLVAKSPDLELEKLQTIFNVNEPFPFLRFEWFSKMKNVKVLYLGMWQSKLTTLRILDLKACHNLEALPVEIAFLKQLTHLDISGCYLLDGLPKGLAHLSELQVLKVFSIGNLRRGKPCTLEDLIGLKKLGKLSITTSSMAFPTKEELHALSNLEAIWKLAIEWSVKQENGVLVSAGTVDSDNRGDNKRPAAKITEALSKSFGKQRTLKISETPELPSELEKLELRCFPHRGRPDWLIPKKLESLKKLYIRGGELENLGQMEENDKWKVEILRLKHLNKFRMNWDVLKMSFPKLIFLENVNCPNLSYSECDKDGLWPKQSSPVSNTL